MYRLCVRNLLKCRLKVVNDGVNLRKSKGMAVHSLVLQKEKVVFNFLTTAKKRLIALKDYVYFSVQKFFRPSRKRRLNDSDKSFSHNVRSIILIIFDTIRSWKGLTVTAY